MKKIYLGTVILLIHIILNSCASVYRCGDTVPEKLPGLWSKRLKTTVAERDSLCSDVATKKSEITELKSGLTVLINKHNKLTDEYAVLLDWNTGLKKEYDILLNESISQTDKLNNALLSKTRELYLKENLLVQREKSLIEMKAIIEKQDSINASLNNLLRKTLLEFKTDELTVEIRNGKIYVSMSEKLLFRSGSSEVEEKGKDALRLLGGVLEKSPDINILVEGHTDNVPIKTSVYKDNWDLSVARATSIVRILSNEHKISPERLTASGKGEYFPIADNSSAEGKARNRRTEIILSPKLDELLNFLNNQ